MSETIEMNALTTDARSIGLFLAPKVLHEMRHGQGHQFFNLAKTAFEKIGHTVTLHPEESINSIFADIETDYAMFHFKASSDPRAVDVRRAAIGPFYTIEKEPSRVNFRLANALFDPSMLSNKKACSFFKIWKDRAGQSVEKLAEDDYIFVPLQGKLLTARSFQQMSPIEMIRTTLEHDQSRRVFLKLHPKETYNAEELAAIEDLCLNPRVHLYDGGLNIALQNCAYVVAQNSSVLLKGLLYHKPGIVFADCEYHHPFQSVRRGVPVATAFANVMRDLPAFEEYFYWYFQCNCINTSREWAGDMIVDQVRAFGWKV